MRKLLNGLKITSTLLLAVALVSACSSTSNSNSRTTSSGQAVGSNSARSSALATVVDTARAQIGTPYLYGGTTPSGFDCSGLVGYSYAKAGIGVPRTSEQLYRATETIMVGELNPGDLLFYKTGKRGYHVGIYLGDQQFVHAPSSGKQVMTTSMNNVYFKPRFVKAGRVPLKR